MKIIDVVGFIKVNNPADLELIIPGMMDLLAEQVSEEPTICIRDISRALEASLLNNPGHGYEIKLVDENYRYVFREEDIPYWKTYTYRNIVVMCRAPRALTRQQINKMDAFCLNWGIYSEKALNNCKDEPWTNKILGCKEPSEIKQNIRATMKEAVEFWLNETEIGRLVRNQFDDITIDDKEEPINIFISDHKNKYNNCMSINSNGSYNGRKGINGITLWLKDCYNDVMGETNDKKCCNDLVNHPNHYCQNGLESIDVIKAFTSDLNGVEAFCAGNAIKYILRFNHKNGEEDLDKAFWYINRLKEEKYHNEETNEKGDD